MHFLHAARRGADAVFAAHAGAGENFVRWHACPLRRCSHEARRWLIEPLGQVRSHVAHAAQLASHQLTLTPDCGLVPDDCHRTPPLWIQAPGPTPFGYNSFETGAPDQGAHSPLCIDAGECPSVSQVVPGTIICPSNRQNGGVPKSY